MVWLPFLDINLALSIRCDLIGGLAPSLPSMRLLVTRLAQVIGGISMVRLLIGSQT